MAFLLQSVVISFLLYHHYRIQTLTDTLLKERCPTPACSHQKLITVPSICSMLEPCPKRCITCRQYMMINDRSTTKCREGCCWKCCNNTDFNQSSNFVGPESGAHTSRIEGTWTHVKTEWWEGEDEEKKRVWMVPCPCSWGWDKSKYCLLLTSHDLFSPGTCHFF